MNLTIYALHVYRQPNGGKVFMATWVSQQERAFGRTAAEAFRSLSDGSHGNPPDCYCDFDHCSFPGCRSIVPSFGAFKEEGRQHPATARV